MSSIPVEIKSVDEPWVNIVLADGSAIKMRIIVFGVEAVYNDNGDHMMTPDGQLAYGVKHGMVFNVTSSPHLLSAAKAKAQQVASGAIEGVRN